MDMISSIDFLTIDNKIGIESVNDVLINRDKVIPLTKYVFKAL